MIHHYEHNKKLKNNYPKDFKGTPVDKNGNFVNLEGPMELGFRQVMKWQFSEKPQKEEKKNDPWKATVIKDSSFLNNQNDCLVWLGHASFFIRINGITILIDPIFYNLSIVKRRCEFPIDPALFKNIDYLLISHNHRDHCDKKSISLLAKNNPDMTVLTGLKLDLLLSKWLKGQQIQAAGWHQQFDTDEKKINIFYLPSKHWSRRLIRDTNESLWGAFVIQSKGKTIYFSGDTGYTPNLKKITELYPLIDVFIIGCGAYSPRWFMQSNHISPEDAVKAFLEVGAKTMIPMHYGCFDLSDEPHGEPIRILNGLIEEQHLSDKIKPLAIGEQFSLT